MTWVLPALLLVFASVVALLPLVAAERRPTSALRLVVEALAVTLAVNAVIWGEWLALWPLEQRW
jgi:hypothetical protein